MKDSKKKGTKRIKGASKTRQRKSVPPSPEKTPEASQDALRHQPQKPSSLLPPGLPLTEGVLVGEGRTLSAAALEAVADAVSIQDRAFRIIYQNRALRDIFGDCVGKYCYQAYHKSDGICGQCALVESFRDGKTHTRERTVTNEKGLLRFEVRATPLRDAAGAIIAGIEIGRNITKRKRSEEALRESEESFRIAFENAPIGMALVGLDERFLQVNQALCAMLGYAREQLLATSVPAITHPEDRIAEEKQKQHIRTGIAESFRMEKRYIHADGHVVWGHLSVSAVTDSRGKPIYFIGQLQDITERKHAEDEKQKLQSQLLQAQKMEAVGQLAGGIAHDFNNILTAIIGYGSIALAQVKEDDPARSYVDQMLTAANRAASLTQSLLAFSRKQIINPQPVAVNAVIERVQKLLHRIIGEDIELTTALAQDDTTVLADAGQLDQVLINLATNARDAMPNGGHLALTTGRTAIGADYIRSHGYGKTGTYVLISITDTGEGMDAKTRERVFEPFFTTKGVGKGTGLGLSIVYGIVKQHNGYINVYSEPRRGTTFKIYLPTLKADAKSIQPAEPPAPPKGGTETVLLAEDDPTIRDLSKAVLEGFGYIVIEAVDGQDAIDKLRMHQDRIQLLIVDVVMPKKNGREVYEEAQRIKPGLKALFTSGYPADIIQKKGILEEGINFISKPLPPQDLLRKVRAVLDG